MIRANNLGGTEARTVLASGGLWVIPSRLAGHSLLRSLGLLPVGVEVWHLRLLCFFFTLISLALQCQLPGALEGGALWGGDQLRGEGCRTPFSPSKGLACGAQECTWKHFQFIFIA